MAETVAMLYYARVAQDATPGAPLERPHDADLDKFLVEHVEALRGKGKSGVSCPATFVDPAGLDLFTAVRGGTSAEFLEASHALTLRLIGEMSGATREGLLVCLQLHDGDVRSAAVLKLQIESEYAATLQTLDDGEALLSSVTDVMDRPGKLQKGALIDDPRPDSDVILGDTLRTEALYFPRAFGIQMDQKPGQAAIDTLQVISDLQGPSVATAARREMPAVEPGPVSTVLEGLGESVPELSDREVRAAVEERLSQQARPVRRVDTQASVSEVVTASDVVIRSPWTGEERVTWAPDTDQGGWVITIRVDEEPTRSLR